VNEEKLKKNIKNVITSISSSFDKKLYSKTKKELEKHWFFKYDAALSPPQNIYQFWDLLTLYEDSCRRWEEHHNGICCVVERVRDKYLMPKIKAFYIELLANSKKGKI